MKLKSMSRNRKCLLVALTVIIVAALGIVIMAYNAANKRYDGTQIVTVRIPPSSTDRAICDSLTKTLGDYGKTVYRLWSVRGGLADKAAGYYDIAPGDKAWSIAGRIKRGQSSTIDVTFNSVRLMDDLARRIAAKFDWSSADFMAACDSILPGAGFRAAEYPAAFWPNTYQFYKSDTPTTVVGKLLEQRNRFWNDDRRAKAKVLGLTPVQVATLASIVEEETARTDEMPVIARLYLNRLDCGMKLQADPTVKFALHDFGLKRLYNKHTAVESPYNTYRINGLPPGPIRIPEGTTIDAVLNAPANNYIYMCAKEDLSGRHNFTADYKTHLANARRYQAELDRRGI